MRPWRAGLPHHDYRRRYPCLPDRRALICGPMQVGMITSSAAGGEAMGRGFVEYRLPESGRDEWVLWSAFLDYRLEDGSKLHILQQAAWCQDCRRFVIAEEVPSVEMLEGEIARYRAADPDTLREWAFVSNGAPVA